MTNLEIYLTQAARNLAIFGYGCSETPSFIKKRIENRADEFNRRPHLLFECPIYRRHSCDNSCVACWNRFFNEFNEVVDI